VTATTVNRRRISDEDIAKEVVRIQERDGVCSTAAFVDAARDPHSPLHHLFDWDTNANSERWLRHQARTIIGRLRIVKDSPSTPVFVHTNIIRDGERREGYVPTEVAMTDTELREQVFREARAGLSGWRNRLAAFEEADAAAAVEALDVAIGLIPVIERADRPRATTPTEGAAE
jgi:hypothetical protein